MDWPTYSYISHPRVGTASIFVYTQTCIPVYTIPGEAMKFFIKINIERKSCQIYLSKLRNLKLQTVLMWIISVFWTTKQIPTTPMDSDFSHLSKLFAVT